MKMEWYLYPVDWYLATEEWIGKHPGKTFWIVLGLLFLARVL